MEPPQILPEKALLTIFTTPSVGVMIALLIMLVLIIMSALISGSEVAYFSLNAKDRGLLDAEKTNGGIRVLKLLESPKKLLATILIANNFVNVAIVMVSTFIMSGIIAPEHQESKVVLYLVNGVAVTFIILLFGEVIPKVYATKFSASFAKFMSTPLSFINVVFGPFSNLLVSSTRLIDKRFKKKGDNISVDVLEHALDLTKESVETTEEKKILEGIVKFGHTDAKQIMTPRLDVISLEDNMTVAELKSAVLEARYSRLPVYTETLDNIAGILYIKDLLAHLDEEEFDWVKLIREPKFVPENKKLDDLLKEFQTEKTHISIVVDEYGGTSGIVTLEDVLEEIVGDITDEFDDDDLVYSKLDDNNFVFEGKTPLMDMYRVIGISGEVFEEEKGESDTIAGFCIERAGKILLKNEKVTFQNYAFTIEAADKRRIKQVKVTIVESEAIEEK